MIRNRNRGGARKLGARRPARLWKEEGRRKRPKLRDVEGAWAKVRVSPSSGT
ncbi:uncharacterized protein GLRG_06586 [Colletotrichum graminicola M1.001]|uniref:Uncharacterized protein n=1 Tax=Colletotrichum graminicola (strain M1.001 / M2 / FGSC 10212) TaxID=645133 RepID=E3QKQ4_COLGM|nr:uncharacterized protein GLRG_06586 [Colletotrichum graminicola M1.001]EFQ31442.1 hypothetical protein GLRG_06586 [Colletotrichum graminicola M1.001]